MSEQVKVSSEHAMTYAAEILSERFNSIYNTAYNLMKEEEILLFENDKEDYVEQVMAIKRITRILQNAYAQNENIEDIYLIYCQSKTVITSAQDDKATKSQLSEMLNSDNQELYNYLTDNNGKFVGVDIPTDQGKNGRKILYIKDIGGKREQGNIYAIFFLNDILIKNTMDMINIDDSSRVLLLDETYNCLFCDDKHVYDEEEKNNIIEFRQVGNKKYAYVLSQSIPLAKLRLYLISNKVYYISFFWPIWILILIISVMIMSMSMIVAKIFSKRVYMPIGNIINMFKPTADDYAQKTEIEFIDCKFEEIQNMKDKLSEHESAHSYNMRSILLENFLKGYTGDSVDFDKEISNFGVHFDTEKYIIALIKIDRLSEIAKNIQEHHYKKFLAQQIVNYFHEIFPQIPERIYEFYDNEYIGILVGHNGLTSFDDGISKLQKVLMAKHNITISVCISNEVREYTLLPEEYKTIFDMATQINLMSGYRINAYEYRHHNCNIDFEQYSKELHLFIMNQKNDEIKTLIDNALTGEVFHIEIIQLYTETTKVIANISKNTKCTDNNFWESNIYSYDLINKFKSLSEVSEFLKKTCIDVSDYVATISQNTSRALNKIMEYIDGNYMREIGLEDMAAEFGYSKNYFSKYFKEVTGKNYIEFLNGFRIKKAKTIIENDSSIKLLTVAIQVGFSNYRTFSTAFKKIEGKSPEEYRKTIWNKYF